MNYPENNIDWQIGDVIIHDADYKAIKCLARIVEKKETPQGMRYRMEYVNPELNYHEWWNSIKSLHDPKRFDISIESVRVLKDE